MPRIIYLICAIMIGFVAPSANAEQALNASQKKEVHKIIAEFLHENPAVLLRALDNVQAHIQSREAARASDAIRENAGRLYHDARDRGIGPKDAPITIVEFFDYNCGYCKRSFDALINVASRYDDVRIVFKEFPILSNASKQAAQYALAIEDESQYVAFHSALMKHRGKTDDATLTHILTKIGVSPKTIKRNYKALPITAHLNETKKLAETLNIQGTPAFIVNDKLYPGALTRKDWEDVISEARAAL